MATKYARELVSGNLNPKKRTKLQLNKKKKQSYVCGESDVLQVLDSEDEKTVTPQIVNAQGVEFDAQQYDIQDVAVVGVHQTSTDVDTELSEPSPDDDANNAFVMVQNMIGHAACATPEVAAEQQHQEAVGSQLKPVSSQLELNVPDQPMKWKRQNVLANRGTVASSGLPPACPYGGIHKVFVYHFKKQHGYDPYKVHVEEQSDHDNIRDIEESSMETDELSSARHLSPPPVSSRGPRKKFRSEAVAAAQSACSRKFRSMAVIDAQKAANVKLTSAKTAASKSVDDAAAGPAKRSKSAVNGAPAPFAAVSTDKSTKKSTKTPDMSSTDKPTKKSTKTPDMSSTDKPSKKRTKTPDMSSTDKPSKNSSDKTVNSTNNKLDKNTSDKPHKSSLKYTGHSSRRTAGNCSENIAKNSSTVNAADLATHDNLKSSADANALNMSANTTSTSSVADLVKGTDTAKAAAVVIGPKWCKLKKDGTLRKKPGPPPADIPGYIPHPEEHLWSAKRRGDRRYTWCVTHLPQYKKQKERRAAAERDRGDTDDSASRPQDATGAHTATASSVTSVQSTQAPTSMSVSAALNHHSTANDVKQNCGQAVDDPVTSIEMSDDESSDEQDADESALDDDNDESMVQSEDDSESEGSDEDEVSKLRRQLEKMTVKANEADALRKQTHVMMQSLHKTRNALKDVLQENKTLVSMCASYRVTAACTAESANMADVVTEQVVSNQQLRQADPENLFCSPKIDADWIPGVDEGSDDSDAETLSTDTDDEQDNTFEWRSKLRSKRSLQRHELRKERRKKKQTSTKLTRRKKLSKKGAMWSEKYTTCFREPTVVLGPNDELIFGCSPETSEDEDDVQENNEAKQDQNDATEDPNVAEQEQNEADSDDGSDTSGSGLMGRTSPVSSVGDYASSFAVDESIKPDSCNTTGKKAKGKKKAETKVFYSKSITLCLGYMAKCGGPVPRRKDGRPAVCPPLDKTAIHPSAQAFMQAALGRKSKATRDAIKDALEKYDKWYQEDCDKWVDANLHRLYGLTAAQGDHLRRQDEAQQRIMLLDSSRNSSKR